MKQALIDDLVKLKNRFTENENKYQAYKLSGSKLVLISHSNTKSEINKNILELLEELVKKDTTQIIIIYYIVSLKSDKVFGSLSMTCEIIPINEKGKLSKKNILVSSIHYTEKELEERGLKKNDYKLLVSKLLNGEIDSEIKKIYTAGHLDD
jgi:hypothetical protein